MFLTLIYFVIPVHGAHNIEKVELIRIGFWDALDVNIPYKVQCLADGKILIPCSGAEIDLVSVTKQSTGITLSTDLQISLPGEITSAPLIVEREKGKYTVASNTKNGAAFLFLLPENKKYSYKNTKENLPLKPVAIDGKICFVSSSGLLTAFCTNGLPYKVGASNFSKRLKNEFDGSNFDERIELIVHNPSDIIAVASHDIYDTGSNVKSEATLYRYDFRAGKCATKPLGCVFPGSFSADSTQLVRFCMRKSENEFDFVELSPSTLEQRIICRLPVPFTTSSKTVGDYSLIPGANGTLYKFDNSSGTLRGTLNFPEHFTSEIEELQLNTAADKKNPLFAVACQNNLYVLDGALKILAATKVDEWIQLVSPLPGGVIAVSGLSHRVQFYKLSN